MASYKMASIMLMGFTLALLAGFGYVPDSSFLFVGVNTVFI